MPGGVLDIRELAAEQVLPVQVASFRRRDQVPYIEALSGVRNPHGTSSVSLK